MYTYEQPQIIATCIQELGINPTTIYCQMTGAPIGAILPDEWNLILAQIGQPAIDDNSFIDDLYVRTICAMRPSPAWNYSRGDRLDDMRLSAPKRLMSHLLGRIYFRQYGMYSNRGRTMEQRLNHGRDLIVFYEKLQSLTDKELIDNLLYRLLEMDAKFDLSKIDSIKGFPETSQIFDINDVGEYIGCLQRATAKLEVTRDKLDRQNKLQTSFLADGGRKDIRRAFIGSFMEVTPLSERQQQIAAKKKQTNDIRYLLYQIMEGAIEVADVKPMESVRQQPTTFDNGATRLRIFGGIKSC